MLKLINKIPAGTFLVPMIVSMLLITFFPNMYSIGGTTEVLFSQATSVIIGLLVFAAGTTLDVKTIGPLLKRHLPMIIFKLLWSSLLVVIYYKLFGMEGTLGVSFLAFTCVVFSLNPAVAMAIHQSYGDQQFGAVYGIFGVLGMAFGPMIAISLLTSGGSGASLDWSPIISVFIPLIAGAVLGNIDKDFTDLFSPLIGKLLPFLGWNLGAGMNLKDAVSSGVSGVVATVMFMVLMSVLIPFDKYVTKNNKGVDGAALWNVAGMSVSNPAFINAAMPGIFTQQDVTQSTAIVMMVCVITSIVSPIVAQKLFKKGYGVDTVHDLQA